MVDWRTSNGKLRERKKGMLMGRIEYFFLLARHSVLTMRFFDYLLAVAFYIFRFNGHIPCVKMCHFLMGRDGGTPP
jgi:hypothetical protein